MHSQDNSCCALPQRVTLSFSRAASFILMGYFMLKLIDMIVQNNFAYLFSGYGVLWLVEMFGFVLLPALIYAKGARDGNEHICQIGSIITVLGIIFNRFNVSIIAFNWHLPAAERYFPSWHEITVSIFIVTLIITVYRFIVYHMPVLYEHPNFRHHG